MIAVPVPSIERAAVIEAAILVFIIVALGAVLGFALAQLAQPSSVCVRVTTPTATAGIRG